MAATTAPALQLSAIIILLASDSNNIINNNNNNNKDPFLNQCGLIQRPDSSQRSLRIVGGNEATSGAWPWQIAVLDSKKNLYCGGTLINSEFVLTAAHCVRNNMRIMAGEYNLAKAEDHEQDRRVAKTFIHPGYDSKIIDNDIALLKLNSPLELTPQVWPACLPEQNEEVSPDTSATILGWGAVAYHRSPRDKRPMLKKDDILYQGTVPIVDIAKCQKIYGDQLNELHVLCAGYQDGKIDSCQGDSGGGLLIEKNNCWHVYGVTSFGDECGKENAYGIYTRTAHYVNWIRRTVSDNSS